MSSLAAEEVPGVGFDERTKPLVRVADLADRFQRGRTFEHRPEAAKASSRTIGEPVVGLLGGRLGDDVVHAGRDVGPCLTQRRGADRGGAGRAAPSVSSSGNGCSPVSISYSTTPRAYTSDAGTAGSRRICSGERYAGVPRIMVPDGLLGSADVERDAEVGEVGVALLVEQDVARLHVPVHDALSMRGGERGRHLVQDRGGSRRLERTVVEQVLEASTSQVPHHQVGGVGLAPVVVERHDVRVLQARDDLRLALEPPDEVRVVRELRVDRLDRHLPPDLRLDRPVDDAERALADLVEQPVAAERLALQVEVRVLPEDPLMELLELA